MIEVGPSGPNSDTISDSTPESVPDVLARRLSDHACVEWADFCLVRVLNGISVGGLKVLGSCGCVFADITELGMGCAKCVFHDDNCQILAEQFLAIVGYSCKDLTRLKTTSKEGVLAKGTGSSGLTCRGMFDNVRATRPRVALLENVEEMARDEMDSSNVDFLHNSFRVMGYGVASQLLDSSRFALPNRRPRAVQNPN
jgi:hypothetical protein